MTKNDLSISARLLFEEAIKRNIKCSIFSQHLLLMEFEGKSWYTCGSRISLQSSVGKTIANYKHLSKKILLHHQLPTAKAVIVRDPEKLGKVKFLTFPVVMKPSFGHQGEGVFVGLNSLEEIKNKIQTYSNINHEYPVVIEELLAGEKEFRVICLDYKFCAAAYRQRAQITGDGQYTIEELINQKNQHPWRSSGHKTPLTIIKKDDITLECLQEKNLNFDSIPPRGEKVILRKTANLSTGGEAINITSSVHPQNIALFEQIARVTDLNLIGIDIKCDSLKTPITDQKNTGVVEINASPGLRMHHFPMQGQSINIASQILDLILNKI